MSQQPTYLLAPRFIFKPDTGPITLGSLIADPFRPHRVLTTIDEAVLSSKYPPVEKFLERDSKFSRDTSRDPPFSIWAQFLQTINAKTHVAHTTASLAQFTMDALETVYFATDPTQEEIEARVNVPRVQAAIASGQLLGRRQPVYMVTGLKIAKNFAVVKERGSRKEGGIGAGVPIPTPASDVGIGADLGGGKSIWEKDEWKTDADIVFAYQLLKIEVKGWKDKTVQFDEFRHKAAYLSNNDDSEDEGGDETVQKLIEVTARKAIGADFTEADNEFEVSLVEVGEEEGKCLCVSFLSE
jgi:hypothetical protein